MYLGISVLLTSPELLHRWRAGDGTVAAVTTVASLEKRKDPVVSFWMT